MDELIARLDTLLRENRSEYYESLNSGATDESLSEFENQFGVTLPESFRKLYQWRDGQPANEFSSLQENLMFSSIHNISKSKLVLDAMIETDFDDPNWWRKGWIPFLSSGGGDHICVDLEADDGGAVGQLVEYWHDEEDREVEFDSLEEWLEDLVESMEEGTLELA